MGRKVKIGPDSGRDETYSTSDQYHLNNGWVLKVLKLNIFK